MFKMSAGLDLNEDLYVKMSFVISTQRVRMPLLRNVNRDSENPGLIDLMPH